MGIDPSHRYDAWRISYQSSEQAARAAFDECQKLYARIAELEHKNENNNGIDHGRNHP
jgi:hypothetical protein